MYGDWGMLDVPKSLTSMNLEIIVLVEGVPGWAIINRFPSRQIYRTCQLLSFCHEQMHVHKLLHMSQFRVYAIAELELLDWWAEF